MGETVSKLHFSSRSRGRNKICVYSGSFPPYFLLFWSWQRLDDLRMPGVSKEQTSKQECTVRQLGLPTSRLLSHGFGFVRITPADYARAPMGCVMTYMWPSYTKVAVTSR